MPTGLTAIIPVGVGWGVSYKAKSGGPNQESLPAGVDITLRNTFLGSAHVQERDRAAPKGLKGLDEPVDELADSRTRPR